MRKYNLDLMRIITMLMVVTLHFFVWGDLIGDKLVFGTLNWYIGGFLHACCFIAVNCFVLLSAFFLCKSKIKYGKLVTMWVQIFFYSVIIYVLLAIFSTGITFSLKGFLKSSLVITLNKYWFVTAYFLMYICSPFLNFSIRGMNKSQHFNCCVMGFVIFSFLHNLVYINDFAGLSGGFSFLWFCYLYIVSSYISLYIRPSSICKRNCFLLYIISVLFIFGERVIAYCVTPHIFGRVVLSSLFYSYNSIFTFFGSIFFFLFFLGLEIKDKKLIKIINWFSPLTFSVYLIHEHELLRPILWDFFRPYQFSESSFMVLYLIIVVIIIFTSCCIVEKARLFLFRKLYIDKKCINLFGVLLKCLNLFTVKAKKQLIKSIQNV